MSEENLIFAILALNEDLADEVIFKLYQEKRYDLSSWLKANKGKIYGKKVDQWKPFKGKTLADIIRANSRCYVLDPTLKEGLPLNIKVTTLKNIKVFFIDIFFIFLEQYRSILKKGEWYFSAEKYCCILISSELDDKDKKYLVSKFEEFWPSIGDCYADGAFHRKSGNEDDVKNFKIQVENSFLNGKNIPNITTKETLNSLFGGVNGSLPGYT